MGIGRQIHSPLGIQSAPHRLTPSAGMQPDLGIVGASQGEAVPVAAGYSALVLDG